MSNEVSSWAKKYGKKLFMLTIHFDKAYDNVNWEFLFSVMDQMGFPQLWCKRIRGVLTSVRSSISVYGPPTFEFECQKGIRQGDHVSPFLFIIVMEAFWGLIKKASYIGAFDGVRLPKNGPVLSHLLYADDAMFMGILGPFLAYGAPVTVVNKLESLMRRFLWGESDEVKKMSWVAWDMETKLKQEGGLGLSRLEDNNKALLLKWFWRIYTEKEALWRKVIDSLHGSNRRWGQFL
ncbi:uncharacterized protein LOC110927989 [Helianthus annuus]|uniref:uncharacterized protein LOC110927989 n=1 Tax=Helianthus annuus TaxID=4232 RepID=UPI000B90419F|nr:uncharacterized protein LOC110927989 [Helianthus annuus]